MSQNILIVDDEESIRFTFSSFLMQKECKVETAATFEEALSKIDQTAFDLIFCDILLGARNGIELLDEIRRRDLNIPVVLITGVPEVDSATEALRLGAYDYLPKPVRREALLRVTEKALQFKALAAEKEKIQANLQALFRSVKDGLVTVDLQLRIQQVNDAARDMCGLEPTSTGRALIEKTCCPGACLELLQKTIEVRLPQERSRVQCVSPHGQRRIMTLSSAPLRSGRGEFTGAVLVIRDETRIDTLERRLQDRRSFHGMIGQSPRMQEIYELLETLAEVPATVLVRGESGTGKELVARALHEGGPRRENQIIRVNCAALSENLLESELFGHVKGAFTGALQDKIGRFEAADGGTIFLDEIGDISPGLQLRLLRVLQEKEIERVGSQKPIKVDARVVAATNQDLTEKIRLGTFREDLFYRLKVVTVLLPALRERIEDIPLLVDHFIQHFNHQLDRQIRDLAPEVTERFLSYHWPGNIRELEHALEHACILCRGSRITLDHLPQDLLHCETLPGRKTEPELIQHALYKAGGNKAKAARLLGISRRTIYRKIAEYEIADH